MNEVKKYLPYVVFAVIAMYVIMALEVIYLNRETPDVWSKFLDTITISGLLKGFGLYFIIFLIGFTCVKVSERVLTSPFSRLLLASLAYTALGAGLFLHGSHMPIQYYFPENWAMDFQFFAISYACIRIADIREKKKAQK